MKKTLFTLSLSGLVMFSAGAYAAEDKPVALWLCSDYLTVEESFQPTALGFAAAVNHDGDVKEATLDVAGVSKVQPQVLQYCKENPKIALRDALVQSGVATKK